VKSWVLEDPQKNILHWGYLIGPRSPLFIILDKPRHSINVTFSYTIIYTFTIIALVI